MTNKEIDIWSINSDRVYQLNQREQAFQDRQAIHPYKRLNFLNYIEDRDFSNCSSVVEDFEEFLK